MKQRPAKRNLCVATILVVVGYVLLADLYALFCLFAEYAEPRIGVVTRAIVGLM